MTDTETILELLAERQRAMRAGEPEALVDLLTEDVVSFSLAPPLQSAGRDADGLRAWFATFDGPLDYEITDAVVEAAAPLAFVHSINRMSAVPRGSDRPFELWFRSTLGLRLVAGRWLIAHEHISTPFYMDPSTGFRAAIDLAP